MREIFTRIKTVSIKNKLIFFAVIIVVFLAISSQIFIHTLNNIEDRFSEYKTNAVRGKIVTLEIEKDLNFVSRCSRDIMLGNSFYSNLEKIEKAKSNIIKNFKVLEESLGETHRELFLKTKESTLSFVNNAHSKMLSLQDIKSKDRSIMYLRYKEEATPLANESRKYFSDLKSIKDQSFVTFSQNFEKDIKEEREMISSFSLFIGFIFFLIMKVVYDSIIKNVKTQESLEDAQSLLVQYKKAIDLSSIVSKTDPKGVITYVNDEFCKVSQYTRKELLYKPHNIIRHNNMTKSAFKGLWQTIKSKKYWQGIVENRKKDGSSYFVDTIIMPIVDREENITEYIAIRKDITDLVELNRKLTNSQEDILNRIGMIAESHSKETSFHVRRVAEYSKIIAKKLGLSKDAIELLYNATALHDIGKVATPDHILNKPGKLSDEEFEEMKKHTSHGFAMLKDSDNEIINAGAIIAHEHHEKFDGTGYPRGIAGEEIDLFARITALADVFDALGSARPYKKSWELSRIIDYIKEQRGKQFDPQLVDIFLDNFPEFIFIRKKFSKIGEFTS